MTRQDELRKMVAEATPGPWWSDESDPSDVVVWGKADELVANLGHRVQPVLVAFDVDASNGYLIAQAPTLATDLAAALDEIERLREAPFPDETGFYGLIGDAMREAEKAMRKFPQPNYVISKVAEEAGEVVKAAIHCAENRETAENLRGEMKQLIAMLYRLWVEGDGVHGLPSVRAALTRAQGDKA